MIGNFNPTEKIKKLLEYNIAYKKEFGNEADILHACLIAPSNTGKTATVERLSEELGKPLQRLLLQGMQEYEVLGRYAVDKNTQTTKFLPASWVKQVVEKPCIIFLDEIDQAITTVNSIMSSPMSDFGIHTGSGFIKFHPETVFVVAGRELPDSDRKYQSLAHRVLVLPTNWWFDKNRSTNKERDISWLKNNIEVKIQKTASNREIIYIADLYDAGIFTDDEFRELLSVNFVPDFVEEFFKHVAKKM